MLMDKIVNLICKYVEKYLMPCIKPKTNKKLFEDFALLANFAYNNRTEETCSTWLLKETLKCKLNPSAYKGFWQTFDALVGDKFDALVLEGLKQVIKTPCAYGFQVSETLEHFVEQQFKEIYPRTLPEEIRWFLACAVHQYICDVATEEEHQVLIEICLGDFGLVYIEHLLAKYDETYDFEKEVAQSLLK